MNCPNCNAVLPPFEHCVMDKQQDGTFRFQFKKGHDTVLTFELTEFQLSLMIEGLTAGGRCG